MLPLQRQRQAVAAIQCLQAVEIKTQLVEIALLDQAAGIGRRFHRIIERQIASHR